MIVGTMSLYDVLAAENKLRDGGEIVRQLLECVRIYKVKLGTQRGRQAQLTAEDKTLYKLLESKGFMLGRYSSFLSAYFGEGRTVFGTGSGHDDFHILVAGLMNTVKQLILRVARALDVPGCGWQAPGATGSHHCARMVDGRVKLLDKALKGLTHVPDISFKVRGLMRLTDTGKGKAKHATGSLGGMKSSAAITMTYNLLLICGDTGDVFPSSEDHIHCLKRTSPVVSIAGVDQPAPDHPVDAVDDVREGGAVGGRGAAVVRGRGRGQARGVLF
jgi:hypothetical protein